MFDNCWQRWFLVNFYFISWSISHYSYCSDLLWPPYEIEQAIIFLPCGFYLLLSFFFFFPLPNLSCRTLECLPYFHTWCGLSVNLECMSEMCCTWRAENTGRKTPHTTAVLRPFFRDHPGEPVPEENFWTLSCKGRLTDADTKTIRLGATPSRLTSAHLHHPPIFYGLDALPAAQPTVSQHWRQLAYSD